MSDEKMSELVIQCLPFSMTTELNRYDLDICVSVATERSARHLIEEGMITPAAR